MAEDDLEITDESSILKGMSGKGMTQMMRGDANQLAMVRRLFDSSLNVGFMAAPTHDFAGAGMTAGGAGREKPRPALGKGSRRVFFGQKMREGNWDAFGLVGCCGGFGDFQLMAKRCRQTRGKGHDAAFAAFGLMDMKPGLREVEVFDAQIEGFAHPQPAGIKQVNDQPSWVMMDIRNRREQLTDFGLGGAVTDSDRPCGAEGGDRA